MKRSGLIAALLLAGCLQQQMGITVVPPRPEIPEPPRPQAHRGQDSPSMIQTSYPGLTRAVEIVPTLYYYEPDELWYTYYENRWHQAFFWNGTWFEPERVPTVLRELRRRERKPDG